MADDKQADHTTRLEVDVMILEYLVYSATKALLEVLKSEGRQKQPLSIGPQSDMLISLVDSFLAMFKTNHPDYQAADELKLGLQLLKFLSLFSHRYSPCPTTPSLAILKDMRRRSALRVNDWLEHHKILAESPGFGSPLSLPQLQRNRRAILAHRAANLSVDESEFFGTPASVSLLDLLPDFMSLSATKIHQANLTVNSTWMQLAADFMQWSALEQYWIFGTQQNEHIDTAFAWGWTDHEALQSDSTSEILMVNEMFRVEGMKMELPEWTLIRSERTKALLTTAAYPETQDLYALSQFEGTMISFLGGMLKSLRQPVLVQMEVGKVEGMSEAETSTFKLRLGWG